MSAQLDVSAVLESAGANPHAPEGSIGWALAQVDAAVGALREDRERMAAALRAVIFQACQGKVLERDACISQARAALAHQRAPAVDLLAEVRHEIEAAQRELDTVTATDDAQSDGIGCAENALDRALAVLDRAQGVQS